MLFLKTKGEWLGVTTETINLASTILYKKMCKSSTENVLN